MFVTEDADGRELCLRPEYTIPVCRQHLAAGAAQPAAFAYHGPVFRLRAGETGEFLQAGVESIGRLDATAADAEILGLALDGLRRIGLAAPAVQLGDMGLLGALLDALGLAPAARRRVCARSRPGVGSTGSSRPADGPGLADHAGLLAAIEGQDPAGRARLRRGRARHRRHRARRRPQRRRRSPSASSRAPDALGRPAGRDARACCAATSPSPAIRTRPPPSLRALAPRCRARPRRRARRLRGAHRLHGGARARRRAPCTSPPTSPATSTTTRASSSRSRDARRPDDRSCRRRPLRPPAQHLGAPGRSRPSAAPSGSTASIAGAAP